MNWWKVNNTVEKAPTLQMKGWWESNINVWFPFMYSQKWTCYFQTRIIMFCLPAPTLIYLWEIYIYFQDRSAYSAAGNMWTDLSEYINCSQTHECENWDWGRTIPRKGIHKCDFRCSAWPPACERMVCHRWVVSRCSYQTEARVCRPPGPWNINIINYFLLFFLFGRGA